MSVLVNTKCEECNHNKVCHMLDRPFDVAENIQDKVVTDMNGMVIKISCEHFDKKAVNLAVPKRDRRFAEMQL